MTGYHDDDRFDSAMRELHRESLASLRPDTLRRLRATRTAAAGASPRRFGWPAVSAAAALLALAIALPLLRPPPEPPSGTRSTPPANATASPATAPPVSPAADDVPAMLAALDESPDFYLWLASNDLGPIAVE